MEKPKIKIEDRNINQSDDMEIEIQSSKKDGSGDNKPNTSIGGPSNWDPYSTGVNVDELKASLASKAVVTPNEKMDIVPPVKPTLKSVDQSIRDADPAPSLHKASGIEEQSKESKTLEDAVKPKHKRKKKKNSSNTEAKVSAI
ncbi:hypothetical protein MIMGU_mgv1a015877mg [Erythranthe guttata]|uniref:Uncharacterized protein n=2 Tax=Erythranthe guttata TaxID=4155 RepID=A0A022QU04_ERYGU|nr:hypothetical protein MIMGU_mgv1a015877mg [Erythranthe guttata]